MLSYFLFKEKKIEAWQLSHVVDNSWLPIIISSRRFLTIIIVLFWFKWGFSFFITFISLLIGIFIFFIWFRDRTRERTYQGYHRRLVLRGLKWGLIWFLFREIWFFFRIFWSFFHISLSPLSRGFWTWPRSGLEVIPAFQVPLLNTVILLIRGVTATLAHQEILKGSKSYWVIVRGILGFYFLRLQGIEYFYSSFTLSSGMYGRVFFFGTGFHGLHVCLGMIILIVRAIRISNNIINNHHHFRLEFRLWYWHFVDVVWLFLYVWVYTWGT